MKHPNATVAGSTSGAGVLVVWILGNIFHVDVSAESGAAIAGGVATLALLVGRHGVRGIVHTIWRGAAATILLALVALLVAGSVAAKKPVHAAATVTLSASWSDGRLVITGCGYDISIDGGVQAVYTHPDGSTETFAIGVWNDDTHGHGCLDSNYILADDPGVWAIATYQAGVLVGQTTVAVG